METTGEKLRKARLQKNISLEDVYKYTKIYPSILEALEQDRAHNFLSPVYIKGFLKSYAQYLGLDSAQLLKEYIDTQRMEPAPEKKAQGEKVLALSQINYFLILKTVLVIILIFSFLFYFSSLWKHNFFVSKKTTAPKVKVDVAPAVEIAKENKDLVLEVRTKDDCWINVKADNKVVFEKTLPKGTIERWQAKEKIELRLGKPEALEVVLNGKVLDLKKANVKKSLLITTKGIEGK